MIRNTRNTNSFRKAPRSTRREAPVKKSQSFGDWSRPKVILVGAVLALLWVALWGRAYYVQVIIGPELAKMARRQHLATEFVAGERGQIFDRNGRMLAKSVAIKSVFARPMLVADPNYAATALSKILGQSRRSLKAKLTTRTNQVWIARQIGDQASHKIKEAKLAGVYLTTEYGRQYPNTHLAGKLLGFVGTDDKGLEGVESFFDARLAGKGGTHVVQRDANQRRLDLNIESFKDRRGKDVKLALDLNVQVIAEEVLAKTVRKNNAKWGGAVVVRVKDGNVLGWAEYPFFNPNAYRKYKTSAWKNRIAMDAYEPGSCVKPFVVAAALQEGVAEKDTIYFCENGRYKIDRKVIRDVSKRDWLPVSKIIRYSSNIGSAKIAMDLGAQSLYSYYERLGFGEKTGSPLPGEGRGILRPPGSWERIDLAAAGFGQGFSVTMLQLAKAYLCLANEGLSKPLRLVLEPAVELQAETRIFDADVARSVIEMMEGVVQEDGSGVRARIKGLNIAGKTSTAQKAKPKGGYGKKVVATFAGFFPAEDPEYLVIVSVDEPEPNHYGGVVAAPAFKEISEKTLAYLGELPDVPFLAENESLKKTSNKSKKKVKQRIVAKNSVPDVVGLSLRTAVEMFATQGVVPRFKGSGTVVTKQSPPAGRSWSKADKTKCTLWLKNDAERS